MTGIGFSSMSSLESAVAAVIQDPVGRVLLCQQREGHQLWGLPGGTIRHAESPIHALIRDVREEVGTDVEVSDLIGLYQLTGDGCGEDLPDVLVYVFRAKLEGETTLNAPGRIRRLSWEDPDALPEPTTATTATALADHVAGRSGVLRTVQRNKEPDVPDADEPTPDPMKSTI
jgi:ADP-ribose pyrophosphatase YjhB (NUDIX family)